jgi:tetratricopeptide (TPR) repeat protein
MHVTSESPRARWIGLICAWIVVGTLGYLHNAAYREYIDLLDRSGRNTTALRAPTIAAHRVSLASDTQMWVRHAIALTQGSGPQLRHTHVDNAPYGREVHWDSGFAWAIAGSGYVQRALTSEPLPEAIEHAVGWFNLVSFLVCVAILSAWVGRCVGLGGALLAMFGMLGYEDFYSGFAPTFVDHHGVLSALTLGLVFGCGCMGVSFIEQGDDHARLSPSTFAAAKRAAVLSALCGGIGMWISAPTLIPAIAMCGIGGAIVVLIYGRRVFAENGQLEPSIWRLWGTIGATVSFAFYLLEYAPFHLGFRLEVNHPLYAAAWWGGAELVAQCIEWRAGRPPSRTSWLRRGLAVAAILGAPWVIAMGGASLFVVSDPFIARLSQYVFEGFSTLKAVQLFGARRLWLEVPWTLISASMVVLAYYRGRLSQRMILAWAGIVAGVMVAMAVAQIRWWPSAAAVQITLMVIAAAALVGRARAVAQWTLVSSVVVLLGILPATWRVVTLRENNRHHLVDPGDAIEAVYRDIAGALRHSQPAGGIVLLASPNASSSISYYGGFETIGTLYWENLAGTKAAAAILSASTADEARALILARGVTHIALLSEEHFLAEYYRLLHPDAPPEVFKNAFGYQLLGGRNVPLWLEPIAYDTPTDVFVHPERVALYRTRFQSAAAEAEFAAALQDFRSNNFAAGGHRLDAALALAPTAAEFWDTKARLLLSEGDSAGAFTAISKAVDYAARLQRLGLCANAAVGFHQNHCDVEAAELCRRGLAAQFDPTVANNLVWLLSTCRDDRARNGAEAVQLADRLASEQTGFVFVSARAAALAESGRFDEAVDVATKAVTLARAADSASQLTTEQRQLAEFRRHRPWRE